MSYTKNYEVGSIRLDSPHKHFIYEMPLLSFSDTMHTIGLSLIFNSNLAGQNDFYMSNGHKLSLQKRLIIQSGSPGIYENGDGSRINLIKMPDNRYAFDDDSQRIIRGTGQEYILEYPDYSTETFTTLGRITSIADKYGEIYLTYTYSSNKLTEITYRSNKTISLSYNNSGSINSVRYICNGVTQCMTSFAYDGDAKSIVSHYSGVTYCTSYHAGEFVAYSADGSTYADHSQKITCVSNNDTITFERFVGAKKVDKVIYNFAYCDEEGDANILDVTDFQGVTTRVQYENKKPAYSYEKLSTHFAYDEDDNRLYYPGTVTFYNNKNAYGIQKFSDGVIMTRDTSDTEDNNGNRFTVTHDFSGLITISGWLKPVDYVSTVYMRILVENNVYVCEIPVRDLIKDVWKYFSLTLSAEGVSSLHISLNERSTRVLADDFRVTCQSVITTDSDNYRDNIVRTSDVIIYTDSENVDHIISTDKIFFKNGEETIDKENYPITYNDLMRYKTNQALGTWRNEIYYNDCRGIITNANYLVACFWLDDDGAELNQSPITVNLTELSIGKKQSTLNNTTVTKNNFYTENGNIRFKSETYEDSTCLKTEIYDEKLDLIESTVDGIVNAYTRKPNTGLVTSHTVKDTDGECVISNYALYDSDNCLKQTTDEFGTSVNYTIDPVWGTVNVTTVEDGITTIDAYDDDGSTLLSRTFKKGIETKLHTFGYENGRLSYVQNNTQKYLYGYSTDATGSLTTVSKNTIDEVIETRKLSDSQKTSITYYPKSDSSMVYSITEQRDNYGRVTDYDNKIINTYDLDPTYDIITEEPTNLGINNSSSKLSTSTDLTTNSTTIYMYRKDLLRKIAKSASSTVPATEEKFVYDNAKRLRQKSVYYSDSRYLEDTIHYVMPSTSPLADNRINTYISSLKNVGFIDTVEKQAVTNISYDGLKRISGKTLNLGAMSFNKNFSYDKTRLSVISESYFLTDIGTQTYHYNGDGTIKDYTYSSGTNSYFNSYVYDSFGQLIRENNQALDKTFIYSYNESGDISLVQSYPYTTGDVSGTPTTVDYTYSDDRLTNFNGKSVTYNSIGYPTNYDGKTWTWTKGKLTRIHKGSANQPGSAYIDYVFTYDAYGRRISKSYINDPNTASSNDYSYTYNTTYNYDNSGRLIREYCTEEYTYSGGSTGTREFIYLYDESGMIGVLYSRNGASLQPYYYQRNAQGDVIAIYDATGNVKAGYAYDAWGNCTVTNSTLYDLAYNNPIRYRGYYYDRETGLYYLNARYYNPEWRRFISPDSTEYIDSENPNGLNLYAYCNNDPVNYKDPSGRLAITTTAIIVGAFIGFAIGATSSVITQLEEHNGDWSQINMWEVAFDGVFGAINGGLAASGINIWLSVGLGAALGFTSSVGKDYLFNDKNIDWNAAMKSLVVGALAGFIAGAGANNVKEGMHVTKFVNSKTILNRTIANGTKRAIARQTHAMNVHANQLLISSVKYMGSIAFSLIYTVCTN